MAVSRTLRRLLQVRELQEEQGRLALESSMGELNRLEDAMKATASQDRRGRLLLDASARSGELPDRVSGLEETRTAARIAAVLVNRIAARTRDLHTRRQEFMDLRVARKQAESLIVAAESADAIESGRRSQRALDDWYSFRGRQASEEKDRLEIRAGKTDAAETGFTDGSAAAEKS
jgi:hypothetical protein